MKLRPVAMTAMLTLLATGTLSASEIYKWTDSEGNIHFGDRPSEVAPKGAQPELVAIVSRPTDRATVQEQNAARAEARVEAAEAKAAATAERPSAEELQAAAAERAEKCATYTRQMEKLSISRRIYRQDEAGERVYLDEGEMLAARQKAAEKTSEYCGS